MDLGAGAGAGPKPARGRLGAPSSGMRAPGTPWARFSAWLECVCVVTFDLELGQALELVYPSDFQLTDKEKSSICYLSFPDSHSGCLGDTQFSFRIRQCGGQRRPGHAGEKHGDSGAPASLQREPAHYFGYVYFRQVKDSSVKRGYFQKSLVLLSRLPFVRLFQALLGLVAPEFFDKLAPCLEAVCNEIDQWPAPAPGRTLSLPVMGVVLQVHIPSRADTPEPGPPEPSGHETLLPAPVVLPSVHELDLFRCFRPVLAHVQLLWELMLLGEPLLVLAPSPAVSSEMVLALTSCLQPLKFCCDYRPYFTIHDSEFKEFTTRTQAPGPSQAGQTEKALEAEDPGHEARSVFLFSSRDPETGLGGGQGRAVGLAQPEGVPPPPEQSTWPSALPRPLHRIHGPPPPRQGLVQTAAEGTAGGGVLPMGGGPRPGTLAQPWQLPGPAEEAAVGCADGGAEAAPLGAHSELHHPSGALHGQPHAAAEGHRALEGVVPGGLRVLSQGQGCAWEVPWGDS
ncbi:protein DENND6B isoform X7 [Ovis aries]|uniref:protein DENND6B isoform X7 n=1 Tax=Ovis aries TaxID=9940 RepID=UPI001C2DFA56|nr:protein DENND6B isoform X7 [Ovis aries]